MEGLIGSPRPSAHLKPTMGSGHAVPTWAGLAHPPILGPGFSPPQPQRPTGDGERGVGKKSGSIRENHGASFQTGSRMLDRKTRPSQRFFASPMRPGSRFCCVPGCLRGGWPETWLALLLGHQETSVLEIILGCGEGRAPPRRCSVTLPPFISRISLRRRVLMALGRCHSARTLQSVPVAPHPSFVHPNRSPCFLKERQTARSTEHSAVWEESWAPDPSD